MSGAFPTYTVTDDQGKPFQVGWTCLRGLWSAEPTCECMGHYGPSQPCEHAEAARAAHTAQQRAAARAAGIAVVTGARPSFSVEFRGEVHAVIVAGNDRWRCSCCPDEADPWHCQCIHAAAAAEFDMAVRLTAQHWVNRDNNDCARTGIVPHRMMVPFFQASDRRRREGGVPR